MAKAEKRPLRAVVAEVKRAADEWAAHPEIEPGSRLHAAYVAVLKRLLAESQKCDR